MTSSYKAHSYRVSKEQCDFSYLLSKDFSPATQQLFLYIMFCTIINMKKSQGWTPISSKFIDKHFKGAKWAELNEADLIQVTNYSKLNKQSREYRAALNIIQAFQALSCKSIQDFLAAEWYNLFTNTRMKVFKRHKLTDETGHPIPDLPRKSMNKIEYCIVNLEEMKRSMELEFSDLLLEGASEEVVLRHMHDTYCIQEMSKRVIEDLGDGFVKYEPSYEMQSSGRIGEVGGMQNISRERKAAGFLNVPGVKNYDLKSSQIWGLIQWLEEANLDTSWATTYLQQDKQVYADRVGVSKDCWKGILLSIVMGGFPPIIKKDTDLADILNSEMVRKHICKEVGIRLEWDNHNQERIVHAIPDQALQAMEIIQKVWDVCGDLIKEIKKWHTWLVDVYIRKPGVSSYPAGKHYCTNACDAKFALHEYKDKKGEWIAAKKGELKRKLAAFYLQGTEAAFIHHLTWVSDHYGYRVYNNQHDGLVLWIEGDVPNEAIEYARRESGLRYASLEEKDFT